MKITVITPYKVITLEAGLGDNLLSLLQNKGIFIYADCGGRGVCNKCKVRLVKGQPDVPIADGLFNSCAYYIKEDITIAVDSVEGQAFCATEDSAAYTVKKDKGYGLAVDIGTTSVAAYLVNLSSGKLVDSVGELNRQKSFGADVLSRISSAKDNLDLLKDTINSQINGISEMFCKKYSISHIKKTVICGNNTMLHLLCGVSPSSMGVSPFTPTFTDTQYKKEYIALPSASAYIGSDIVAGVLACGMYKSEENSLLADIGTNGEMVIKYNGKYYACATAAGPAFEGGNITMGMGGVTNAIDHIRIDKGEISYSTVGGEAKGICGSGLIDLIAILLRAKIVDETGRMEKTADALSNRIKDDKFFVTDKVYITQKDIREFQLAKSAVRSGIEVLLSKTGCTLGELSRVYLAGGLGYYIDKQSALDIGLLPKALGDKISVVGNTAGKGAIMCLVNNENIDICETLAKEIEIIELSDAEFFDAFIDNMGFDNIS